LLFDEASEVNEKSAYYARFLLSNLKARMRQ